MRHNSFLVSNKGKHLSLMCRPEIDIYILLVFPLFLYFREVQIYWYSPWNCTAKKICRIWLWIQEKIPHTILSLYLVSLQPVVSYILFIITKVFLQVSLLGLTFLFFLKKSCQYVRNKPSGIGEEKTLRCGSQSRFWAMITPFELHIHNQIAS